MFRRSILSCALNSKRKQIKLFLFCLVTLLNFSLKFLNCCSWNGWNFTSLCGFFHFFLCCNNNPKPNRRVEMICLPKPLPTSKDGKRQSSWGCGKKSLLCFILAKKKKKSSWRILWQWNKLHLSRIPRAKVDFCCISSEIGHDNVSLGLIFPNTDNPQRPVLEEICFSLFSKFKSFPIQWYGVLYILIFSSCHVSSKLSYIQNVS